MAWLSKCSDDSQNDVLPYAPHAREGQYEGSARRERQFSLRGVGF